MLCPVCLSPSLPLPSPRKQAKGTRTPVPYFCGGQALLGTDTGQLLAAGDAGRREWRPVCRVPHPILCMAAPGQSPSSIMH